METGAGLVKTGAVLRPLRWVGALLLDTLYPPVCLSCDAPVATADALCPACFVKLRPISAPMCPVLGLPFEVSLGPGALSAEAIADPPPFDRARAAVVYNEVARALVSKLKYGDRPELSRFLRAVDGTGRERALGGGRGAGAGAAAPDAAVLTALQPVDGTGPSAVAAHRRAGRSAAGQPKEKDTAAGGTVARCSTAKYRGAFQPSPQMGSRLRGRRVIIVDDVVTTGSTVKAVTRALKAGGAERIDVMSFARVVVGSDA